MRKKICVATDSTVDDPDWQGLNDNPNVVTATVGGTTTDGIYTITAVWLKGKTRMTVTASYTRAAAATDADIAAGLEDDLDSDVDTTTGIAFSTAATTSVNSATITITYVPGGADLIYLSATTPHANATITFAPDAQLPITAPAPFVAGDGKDQPNLITISTHCLNSSGTVLDPASSNFDIEVVEIATVNVLGSDGNWTTVERVVGSAVDTEVPVGCAYDLPISGSNAWTVRLLNVDALPATTTQLEVIYRTNVG